MVDAVPAVDDVRAELAQRGLAVDAVEVRDLEAVYLDTADLALQHARITLRRRAGGPDEGWHLKLPSGDEKHEVQVALTRSRTVVPATLRRLVVGVTGGADLVPVASLRTRRTAVTVSTAAARVEVALDDVEGERLEVGGRDRRTVRWCEIEAELVDGDPAELDDVVAALQALGAAPAEHPSKVGLVLGAAPPPRRWPDDDLGPRSPVADVVLAYLEAQRDQARRTDPQVRAGVPEGVHDLRVAVRRIRSTIRTWRRIFEPGSTQTLERELRWLSDALGRARDAEVVDEQLSAALAGVAAAQASLRHVADDAATQRTRLLRAMGSARYRALLTALDALVADPPLSQDARRPLRRAVRGPLRRAHRRMVRRTERAVRLGSGPERDQLLHRARKAAKRARYAAEAVAPALADPAERYAAALERLQDALGAHQDAVLRRARVTALAAEAPPEGAFQLGRQHTRDDQTAEHEVRRAARALRKVDRGRRTRWFA